MSSVGGITADLQDFPMLNTAQRFGLFAVVTAIIAATSLWWFKTSDEGEIRQLLDKVTITVKNQNLHAEDLRCEFETLLHRDVVVRIPDLTNVWSGREAVVQALLNVRRHQSITSLSLDQVEVAIDTLPGTARAAGDATITLSTSDKEFVHRRRVEVQLSKHQDQWKVSFVEVAGKTNEQPEARP